MIPSLMVGRRKAPQRAGGVHKGGEGTVGGRMRERRGRGGGCWEEIIVCGSGDLWETQKERYDELYGGDKV